MSDTTALSLRPISLQDSADLLAWRNDPLTRANSRNTEPVGDADHAAWLAHVLDDPNRRHWIGEAGGEAVGTVSLARRDVGAVEISVTVAPAARGRGWGAALVRAGVAEAGGLWPGAPIRAAVKPVNRASRALFEGCGFRLIAEDAAMLTYALET